jgi:tetratricopeptide (TPR) repeat protein
MTKLQTRFYFALGVLAVLYLSATVSPAQTGTPVPGDPFAVVPASDALILVDLKRFSSDAIPRLLVDEPEARALVLGIPDPKTVELLDARAMHRMVVGLRYSKSRDGQTPFDFDLVVVAQSSEAGQLPALIRSRGAGKYREQQYAGKTLYITQLEQAVSKKEATSVTSAGETEWAIAALDANTLVFGSPAVVRSSIDVTTGKAAAVSAELVTAVKTNAKALLSAAGGLPSLSSAGQQFVDNNVSQILSSLKRFYASVELTPNGFEAAVTLNTTSPEQTKTIVDLVSAFKTISVSLGPGKTKQDKVFRALIKGLVISGTGTEVQIRDEITQASANEVAKYYSAAIYFARGLAHVQKGNANAAIAEFDKTIILDPDNANTFINRGSARSKKGARDAAIADYDKAISLDPNSGLAYNNRCFEQVEKRNFEAAIVDCDKAIALDPTFAYAYNNRGLAFDSLGKLDKALPDYDKSIALDAENISAYLNRGDARGQIGDWDGSLADYEKVIALDANSALGYNGRGLARYWRGEVDQALADFNKALALDPGQSGTYNNRGLALVVKGDLDKASADYDKAIELNDKNAVTYVNRGNLRNQKGDWIGALADFNKAIAFNPNIADAYNGRGLTHYFNEKSDLAIADFDKAIAINPIAPLYLHRGYARNQKTDYDGAIADFNKALSLDPKLAEAYNARGLAHYYKFRLNNAIADYDQAIAINPNFAEAYGNRALCLLALHKDAQASQDLIKCFELNESLRPGFEAVVKEIKKTRRPKSRKHH